MSQLGQSFKAFSQVDHLLLGQFQTITKELASVRKKLM